MRLLQVRETWPHVAARQLDLAWTDMLLLPHISVRYFLLDMTEVLFLETFSCFLPPYEFRWPDIYFEFDPEAMIEAMEEVPEVVREALQYWAGVSCCPVHTACRLHQELCT